MPHGPFNKEHLQRQIIRWTVELATIEAQTNATRAELQEVENFTSRVLAGFAIGMPPQSSRAARSSADASQSGIASRLRYYTGGVGGVPRMPHQLQFNEPSSSSDRDTAALRSESARLATFGGAELDARDLAAAGFYRTENGGLRCIFCRGELPARQHGESAMAAHARQFCTCPFVLGMDVGNVPKGDDDTLRCGLSVQGADPSGDAWDSEAAFKARSGLRLARPDAPEGAAFLTLSGLPIVSAATVCAAAARDALANLETLEACASDVPPLMPQLQSLTSRLGTFSCRKLSENISHLAYSLAEAGFSISEKRQLVCFSCGLSLLRWPAGGDAWVTHAAWSPRCAHLLRARGAAFVRAARASTHSTVQAARESLVSANAASFNVASTSASAGEILSESDAGAVLRFRNGLRDVRARLDWPMLRDAQRVLGGGGVGGGGASCSAAAEIRTLIELRLTETGADFSCPEQLLACALQLRVERLLRSMEAEDFLTHRLNQLKSAWPSEPAVVTDSDQAWRTCKVCLDCRVDVLLRDCGHLCCCSRCCRNLAACPICRADIRAELLVKL